MKFSGEGCGSAGSAVEMVSLSSFPRWDRMESLTYKAWR